MPSIQFQLDAPLARVEAHVRATYGPGARVVSVRELRTGGVGGFFARRTLDVVVEVPDAGGDDERAGRPTPTAASEARTALRGSAPASTGGQVPPAGSGGTAGFPAAGLAGLLAEADAGDGATFGPPTLAPDFGMSAEPPTRRSLRAAEAARADAPPRTASGGGSARPEPSFLRTEQPTVSPAQSGPPTLSTQSRRFAEVLDSVQAEILPPKPPAPETIRIAPALSRLAGDLVVIVGLGNDATAVADSLATARGPYLRGVGGDLAGTGVRADDRRGAIGLRAAGVERGLPALVAFGLGSGGAELRTSVQALRSLAPDQVWVAVDVSRKPDDTVRWVTEVRSAVAVDAIAVLRGVFTASPDTAAALGLPEGWSDADR